jgi:alpha-tubulin suppressor-like RCC1 family protein
LRTAADAVGLTVGSFDGCLRTAGGQVRCWGANGTAEVGNGNTLAVSTPFVVPGITDAWATTMGTSYACALSRAGGVICWGAIGRNTLLNPTPIAGLPADLVGFAGNFYCALQASGLVWCWGPIAPDYLFVAEIKPWLTDVASASGPCAVQRSGSVLCNGTNNVGQLGDGTMNDSLDHPVQVLLP